jgi:hypothetical protein
VHGRGLEAFGKRSTCMKTPHGENWLLALSPAILGLARTSSGWRHRSLHGTCFALRSCGASGVPDAKSSSKPIHVQLFKPPTWPGVTLFTQVWQDLGILNPLTCFVMTMVSVVLGKILRILGVEVMSFALVSSPLWRLTPALTLGPPFHTVTFAP